MFKSAKELDKITEILKRYGSYGRTCRVVFSNYAYILVAKELGLDWNFLSHDQKIFLKGDMILQFSGQGFVNDAY